MAKDWGCGCGWGVRVESGSFSFYVGVLWIEQGYQTTSSTTPKVLSLSLFFKILILVKCRKCEAPIWDYEA